MLIDLHTHTDFSGDCKIPPEEMIETAIKKGVRYYGITDHHDLDFPECGIDFTLDLDSYARKIGQLKKAYNSETFTLLFGMEYGLQQHLIEPLDQLMKTYDFDYVIGSNHIAYGVDPYDKNYFNNLTRDEGYHRFYQSTQENLKIFDKIHILGHLDYVIRYWRGEGSVYHQYEDHQATLEEIFTLLIQKDITLEVNTSGYKYRLNQPHPSYNLLEQYYKMGGRNISLGSDAHLPDNIVHGYDQTIETLKKIGFTHTTYYQKGKTFKNPL